MATEEKMTITETAPDGTETTVEITTKTVTAEEAEAEKGLIERVVDAIFDTDSDEEESDVAEVDLASDAAAPGHVEINQVNIIQQNNVEFNVGGESFPQEMVESPVIDTFAVATESPLDDTLSDEIGSDPVVGGVVSDASAESGGDRSAMQADAAREAQEAADRFVEQGDYRAAAEAREAAEQAAGEAGDQSMLGVYDAQDLSYAADKQDAARDLQQEQADLIAQGDYEGAREAAQNAGYATRDADMAAGGADHTGQSGRDVQNLDWATYKEDTAKENVRDAEYYAEAGNQQLADDLMGRAADNQAAAAGYAEMADPNSIMQDHDPSSAVDSGGSYDAALASVDTGFDAPMDAGVSSFDTTTDDVV